jgi:hypothetical protein
VCRNCHNLCTLKIPPAEFVKRRLLGAAAEAKFVREHKIYLLSSCTSIVFLTNLNYPYSPTFINDPTNINFDPNT